MFTQEKYSRMSRYMFVQRIPNSWVLILRSDFTILRIADNCVWTFDNGSLYSVSVSGKIHSMNSVSSENALRATPPVEVVPPLG